MKTTFSYTCLGKKIIIEKHDRQNLKFYIKTKQRFAETSENTKEKQLYIIQQETVEISLELIKLQRMRFANWKLWHSRTNHSASSTEAE